jgi:hypothetical protein
MTTKLTPAGKKAPVATGAPANPKLKAKKPKKPKKPANKVLVCIVVFVVLLAGAGYCLYANVGGIAEKALVLLPQYKKSLADLDKQKKDIAAQQTKVQAASEKNTSDAKANAKTSDDLRSQQDRLTADKKAFQAEQQQAKTEAERQKAVADIYASLDSDVAAAMLLKAPSLSEAASILKLLAKDKIAEILTAINAKDPKTAYNLAKLIGQ